jgi:hypothetical protein
MTALDGTDLGSVFDSMSPYLSRPLGSDGTGPTSFADPEHTREVLAGAGFRDISSTRVQAGQVWGRDVADATEFISGWGPVRYQLGLAGPEAAAQAKQALGDALQPFAADVVRLRGTAWLVKANV